MTIEPAPAAMADPAPTGTFTVPGVHERPPELAATWETTLPTALRHWARTAPDRTAITFLDFSDRDRGPLVPTRHEITFGELHRRARLLAGRLLAVSSPGDRVGLLLPNGVDYVVAFAACLDAGLLAIPLYDPDSRRTTARLEAALRDAQATASIVRSGDVEVLAGFEALAGIRLVTVDTEDGPSVERPAHRESPDEVAYLQYTSGSTTEPKGVMVTHRNIAVGATQIRSHIGVGEIGTTVTWLPFFHDMGLVSGIATTLQAGGHLVCMGPLSFVQQPARWLQAISDFRAPVTVCPNFSLDICISRVTPEQRAGLDLSCLRMLLNGSEPVRPATLDRFTEAFAGCGFDDEAHRPGYGLAEATLVVACTPPHRRGRTLWARRESTILGATVEPGDGPGSVHLAGSGTIVSTEELRAVDPETCAPLPEGTVGELWLRGENVCAGLWGQPAATEVMFGARLAGDPPDARPWLRTGDIGFVRDGELYVVDRLKDLIIVGGTNHSPVDIEATVTAALPEARIGHVAALALPGDGVERLVLVAEIEPAHAAAVDPDEVFRRVRAVVAREHGIETSAVFLTRRGAIPRTTSGKLQRTLTRTLYESDRLPPHRA